MNLEIIKMAFESLLAKKTRTLLSMLGIIIGVATVIAVFAVGKGAQESVNSQFQNLSANSILIMPNRGRGFTSSSKLATGDAQLLLSADHISSATGAIQGNATVSYGATDKSYGVVGVDANFITISNLIVEQGRGIEVDDVENKTTVAVVGSTVVSDLFSDGTSPIGTEITVGGKKIEIVGVLKKLGSRIGMISVDSAVIIPSTTAEKSILGSKGQVMITTTVDNVDNTAAATSSIVSLLRTEHKLKTTQENDFQIMDAGSMVAAAQESAKTMTALLTAIAAITLLVSGIGIMNVMFVTVAERTKEIGIAKAIGGKQADILSQFLLESVILSMVGGLIGMGIGQGAIPIISYFDWISMASSWTGPLIGFSFSVLVGVFFGFYPAFKASRLDPVDALRSE
ncbi:MAG: ABC transporter permease [Candidatus Falkowbacteria bacterium]|nr:MAG: ABC transporter permease [Candidatus Falkowbacteria bacterium]